MINIVIAFIIAALLAALSGLVGDEMHSWLELVPRAVLRLAATRLLADQRQAIYDEEWLPELIFELNKAEGRPITRLIRGTRYAISMTRTAGQVGRTLAAVRELQREITSLPNNVTITGDMPMTDVAAAVDRLDVYKDRYGPDRTGGVTIGSGGLKIGAEGIIVDPERPADANLSRYLGTGRSGRKMREPPPSS